MFGEDISESVPFETATRATGVSQQRVLRAVLELNSGKYTVYEGPEGLDKLADKVKSRGRRRLATRKSRKPL